MAQRAKVYTFSTKDKEAVEELKLRCTREGLNFSAIIIKIIRNYNDERRT